VHLAKVSLDDTAREDFGREGRGRTRERIVE
jgi:hypothetical protein